MSGGFLHLAMLGGLGAVAVPVVIHLLSRREEPVIPWAAMQFLELAPRQRRRIRFADALLMLARMLPLALAALALARPFWNPTRAASDPAAILAASGPRDVVLILDGSASLGTGPSSPRDRAVRWARRFVGSLSAGETAALLVAGDSVVPVVSPPRADLRVVDEALGDLPPSRGSGDLAAAVAEALRILGEPRAATNPARQVVVLTDGHRGGWRPDDTGRWSLLGAVARRMDPPVVIQVVTFPGRDQPGAGPDGAVSAVTLEPAVATPGQEVEVVATIENAGPGSLTRAVELRVDGDPVAGSTQVVEPIPPGGRASARFKTVLPTPGDHLVGVHLAAAADPDPADDQAFRLARVVTPSAVLLVEDPGELSGRTGPGPTFFLRAALVPAGVTNPGFVVRSVSPAQLSPDRLAGAAVVVLAGDRPPTPPTVRRLGPWVEAGGSLVLIPGLRADAETWNRAFGRDLLPASLGPLQGDPAQVQPVARPDPRSFAGSTLAPLGSEAEAGPIAQAAWFAVRKLEPAPGANPLARFNTGDSWIVERARGRGRVALCAAGFDAESGTVVANPDFVPLVQRWFAALANRPDPPAPVRPGSPLVFSLDPPPSPGMTTLNLTQPSGTVASLPITRSGPGAVVTLENARESGVYRLDVPDRPRFAIVEPDPVLRDPTPLSIADRDRLAAGASVRFAGEADPIRGPSGRAGVTSGTRREAAPALLLLVLAGLCLEIALTRRMARGRGPALGV